MSVWYNCGSTTKKRERGGSTALKDIGRDRTVLDAPISIDSSSTLGYPI